MIEHLSGGDAELRIYLEGLEPDSLDHLIDGLLAKGNAPKTPQRCAVPNCDLPYYALNYCERHYTNWRRHGQAENPWNVCEKPDCWRPKGSCAACKQPVQLDED